MIEDIRTKILSLRQGYADELDRLIDELKGNRISADEYRQKAAATRSKFFEDDKAAHEELANRFNRFPDREARGG
jgi:hypothetical protein